MIKALRVWLAAAFCAACASANVAAAPKPPQLTCAGAMEQGGIALCRTEPGAEILVDGASRGRADQDGWAVIGFDRDAGPSTSVAVVGATGARRVEFAIAPRAFDIQRVDGLPPQTVTPTEPAVLERIRRDAAAKSAAVAGRAPAQGWLEGFTWPVVGPISGAWGNQRVLNGEPRQPHYGVDIAAPAGTPILAPASGVVTLARADMHFEGGLVILDHGQGLFSYYLHMSAVDVRPGDVVVQGQRLGAVGATGRATGPHLCWRMRWRDRQVDPSRAIAAMDAARAAFGLDAPAASVAAR